MVEKVASSSEAENGRRPGCHLQRLGFWGIIMQAENSGNGADLSLLSKDETPLGRMNLHQYSLHVF